MVDAEVEEGSELKGRSTFDLRYVPGLDWVPDFMLGFVAKPIARELFQGEGAESLDWVQTYMARYEGGGDGGGGKGRGSLVEHTDDSEVTCNLCLSGEDDFDGGELCFGAARGEKDEGDVTALKVRVSVLGAKRRDLFHSSITRSNAS